MYSKFAVQLLAADGPGGDDVRVIFGDVEHSRKSLRERSMTISARLRSNGLDTGDRVAVLSAGRMEILELFFGVAGAGGINVVLNSFLKGEMLVHQLELTRPRLLVVDHRGWIALGTIAAKLTDPPTVIELDHANAAHDGWQALTSTDPPGPDIANEWPASAIRPDDPVSIVFTSGTTGRSKGCVISHRYFVECGTRIVERLPLDVGELQYTTYPLFHIGGQVSSLGHSLLSGASIAYDNEFRASMFWERVRQLGATYSQATGAVGMALLAQPASGADRDHPLRRASWIPMSGEAQDAFGERFGVSVISEFYGQTEFSPVCIDATGGSRGTMGVPLPDVDVRLVDIDGDPVPSGAPGELLVRPQRPGIMFSGYWGEPHRTVEAWRDLWYHTGDVVTRMPNGSLRFVDRRSDAVRRSGENVSCWEVEQVLLRLPGVSRAAVHALPAELIEDEIKAWLVLDANVQLTPQDVFETADALPYFAIPRFVEFASELPLNAMGKVEKEALRAAGCTPEQHDLKMLGLVLSREQRR